jgi:hypothetical protein
MKKITITVTDEVADAVARLGFTGRLKNDSKRTMPRYRAFELMGYAARGSIVVVDGERFVKPERYSYGGR